MTEPVDLQQYAIMGAGIAIIIALILIAIVSSISKKRKKRKELKEQAQAKKSEALPKAETIQKKNVTASQEVMQKIEPQKEESKKQEVKAEQQVLEKEQKVQSQPPVKEQKVEQQVEQVQQVQEQQVKPQPVLKEEVPQSQVEVPQQEVDQILPPMMEAEEKIQVQNNQEVLQQKQSQPVTEQQPVIEPQVSKAQKIVMDSDKQNGLRSKESIQSKEKNGTEEVQSRTPLTQIVLHNLSAKGITQSVAITLDEQIRIGRAKERNDFVVEMDLTVSSRHCKIYKQDGIVYIIDLNSTNGTKVNGKIIHQPVRLENEDEVQIGQTLYRLMIREYK